MSLFSLLLNELLRRSSVAAHNGRVEIKAITIVWPGEIFMIMVVECLKFKRWGFVK